ncbi:MAG TPA: c-type cytochrome [Burkholderiales bacterium]|nr:c-type cytochrome [Burkholderiales bacterium]
MKDEGHDHAHSSPIKTPKQLVVVIVLSFLIPILGIILLTQFVLSGKAPSPAALDTEAIAERIKPVADVVLSGSAEATAEQTAAAAAPAASGAQAAAGPVSGEAVFNQACAACHGTGVMGAPKIGDAAQWGGRISKGKDGLYASALNGMGLMPPRGGNLALTDEQVKAAVDYILESSK